MLSADIEQKIDEYKNAYPQGPTFVLDIRERLIRDGVCKPNSTPSLTTLTRMLRSAGHNIDDTSLPDGGNSGASSTEQDQDDEIIEKSMLI